MSWLSNAFGRNKNPADEANKYLNQIPGAMQPYYQSYIDRGQQAGSNLSDQYNQMSKNPNEFYANLGKGYQESPGYQYKLQQAMSQGANASARGGMLGTPQDVQYSEQTAHDIANQDYEDYMKHILDVLQQEQLGQQQQQQQGYEASTGYGSNLGSLLGSQGQLAYQGAAGDNARRGQNWSNLFGGLGALGGAIAGGPLGSMAGNWLTKKFGD